MEFSYIDLLNNNFNLLNKYINRHFLLVYLACVLCLFIVKSKKIKLHFQELIKIGAHAQPLGSDGSSEWGDDDDVPTETNHQTTEECRLRPVVVDGSNVAMR